MDGSVRDPPGEGDGFPSAFELLGQVNSSESRHACRSQALDIEEASTSTGLIRRTEGADWFRVSFKVAKTGV
jgi:hypothetical protein